MLHEAGQNAIANQILCAAVFDGEPEGSVAAREGGGKQILRPATAHRGLPDIIAIDQLHGLDAGFASTPPFDHALHTFKGMKIHGIGAAFADHDRLFNLRAERHLNRGDAK